MAAGAPRGRKPTPIVPVPPASALEPITRAPFKAQAPPERPVPLGSILTTESCELSCVMCHFNGPQAPKKTQALDPALVERTLDQLAPGQEVPFAATGDFFMEPHALDYLRAASARGLRPWVLTHGQSLTPERIDAILAAGVRLVRMSVDSTDAAQYRKIRRGGELERILAACAYLRAQKDRFPGLRVEINCTLFRTTVRKQEDMLAFWRGKVDQVNFNAEYYDIFRFRNVFFVPEKRVDCRLQLYVLPSGRVSPCCATTVYAHDHDVSWLPHVSDGTLEEAYDRLRAMYEDAQSPLGKLCAGCDWWIMWARDRAGNTPYLRCVPLDAPDPAAREPAPRPWHRRLGSAARRVLSRALRSAR